MQSLLDLDYKLFKFFNLFAHRSDAMDFFVVFFADYVMFLLIAGLAVFVILKKKKRSSWIIALQALAAAFLGRALIIPLIRIFFFRLRPFVAGVVSQLLPHNPFEGSFPSGHTTVMFAIAFSLFSEDRRWGAMYLCLALLSGLARVSAGVHFPSDILGGIVLAGICVVITKRLFWGKLRFPH